MIIAGKDDRKKTRNDFKKSKRKRQRTIPKIDRNPTTTPWVYAPYGKCPNIIVSYGIVRKHMGKPWFSIHDFYMFQNKRFLMKRLSDAFRPLVKAGYLEVKDVPLRIITEKLGNNKTRIFRIHREYRTTIQGQAALSTVAEMHRKKVERQMRRAARESGQRGAAIRYGDDWD